MPKPEIPEGYTLATFRPIWMAVTARKKMSEAEQYGLWRLVDEKIGPTGPNHDRRSAKKITPTYTQDQLVMKFTERLRQYLAEDYPTPDEQKHYLKEMADLVKGFREGGKGPASVTPIRQEPPKSPQQGAQGA